METSLIMGSNFPCIVCNTLVLHTCDNLSLSSPFYSEEHNTSILFLLGQLLEIPKPLVNFGDESRDNNGQFSRNSCSRFLGTCEQCTESIKQASLIYQELRELAKKFRGIQKKILETFKNYISTATGETEVVTVLENYRKLVNNCDYNGFGFPFVVQDDMEYEDLVTFSTINASGCRKGTGNEDDLGLSKSRLYEVVIKQEENTDNQRQEILLIFPEGEEEEEDDDKVSQMESEEEDGDDQSSQVDSKDDDDDQVSPINSEEGSGDSDDQVSSDDSEDEDDDQEEDLDLPQDQKTGHTAVEAESDKESYSKGDQPGTIAGNNRLSSFICKKCLHRFTTPTELEEHHKTAHSKEPRETYPCPLDGCRRVYTYTGIFPKHFQKHHSKPPFKCKDCQQEFSNPDQVRIHHKKIHPLLHHHQPKNTTKIKASPKTSVNRPKPPAKIKTRPRSPQKLKKQPSNVPKRRCGRPRKPPQQQPESAPKPPKPFPCPLCHHSLQKFSTLRAHLKRCHPNKTIPLNELRLKFLSPPPLPNAPEERGISTKTKFKHLGISTFEVEYPHIICERNSQGKFPCPFQTDEPSPCPRVFPRKGQLQQHIKARHLNLPLYTCNWSGDNSEGGPICGKTFIKRQAYVEHYDEHRETPGYKCEDCGMTFYRRNPFTRHRQLMHLDEKFICESCGMEFSCKDYLYTHKSNEHKGGNFSQQRHIQRRAHYQRKDCDDNDSHGIICDLCGKLLKNRKNLRIHVQVKHDKIPGKYCCHLCGNRYRGITHLNMHLWQKHELKAEGFLPKERVQVARKDKFQCEVKGCKRMYLTKENLERHRIEVHGEDGNKLGAWKCKHCGKNFFWKDKWEYCERVHENKERRPEKCEVCGKGFPTKNHLRFHQKYTHKMELESKRGQTIQKF